MTKYYQKYDPKIGKWLKIEVSSGLIMIVRDTKFDNISENSNQFVEKQKSFWELF